LVLAWSVKLGFAGCVLGIIATVCATRLVRSLLFRVDPLDTATIIGAGLLLVFVVAASLIPALQG